jgi:chemotaxis protein histidine kinase CheA
MVPAPVYDAARGYIELLFGNRVKEGLVASLNPLSEVEVKLQDGKGETLIRYLSFQFNRVVQDKQVPHLLVTVQDVTERVQLVRQLSAAKSEARLEVDVLLRMLSTEPKVLRDFLNSMDASLQQINDSLRSAGDRGGDYHHVVTQSFRLIHACKGEAAVLGLEMLETQAHEFERELATLRERGGLEGSDMVALSVALNTLFDRVNMVRNVTERIAGLSAQNTAAVAPASHDGLESLATRIASSQKKQVYVSTELGVLDRLPGKVASDLRQIAIQLVRNAVTHGIEVPEERMQLAKPLAGRIYVACQPVADGSFEFVMRDDGRGLSPERIRTALVTAGECSVTEAAAMDEQQLVMRIFEPGFSTAETVDMDAGRGVGMDVVLDKVKALGGKLHLSTRLNEYTEFSIRFPGFAAA